MSDPNGDTPQWETKENDTRIGHSRSTCNRKKVKENFVTLPLLC
jgi:hypothetical protein